MATLCGLSMKVDAQAFKMSSELRDRHLSPVVGSLGHSFNFDLAPARSEQRQEIHVVVGGLPTMHRNRMRSYW